MDAFIMMNSSNIYKRFPFPPKKEKTKDIEPHRIDTERTVFENAAMIFSITESE